MVNRWPTKLNGSLIAVDTTKGRHISVLNFEVVLTSLSMDASFHCGSNNIIGGRRYLCRHKSLSPVSLIFSPGVVDTGQK
jgi:hypothetical protein